jgi:glycosyltransferase involved in cell wall biosynthesis
LESHLIQQKVSVVIPVYNAEADIGALLEALLRQTRPVDEIVLIDDGSSDSSRQLIEAYLPEHPEIRYFYQSNQGCAAARNAGWRKASGEICVFTDDDCLPEDNWLEELLKPLADPSISAVGGVYRTLRPQFPMASFVGLEFEYKYRKIEGDVDCHGTYSLAVYRRVLEEVGGFNTSYGNPCADDWDLTYKISYRHRLVVQKSSVVGHYHPERFWPYIRTQYRRAVNRIRLYQDHPLKKKGDSFTNPWIPLYLASTALFFCLFIAYFFGANFRTVAGLQAVFLLLSLDLGLTFYLFKNNIVVGFYGIAVQFSRNCAWILGIATSYLNMFKIKLVRSHQ